MTYVLLTWNPGPDDEAQYTPEEWLEEVVLPLQLGQEPAESRWSIGTNWKVIGEGDRACMFRQGDHGRGIVATGVVTSDPYLDPHWDELRSGDAHYVKVVWKRAMPINEMITLDELEQEVPTFNWRAVYGSGRIVDGESAAALAVLIGDARTGPPRPRGQKHGTAEHKRLVELEAMRTVAEGYTSDGWKVEDVSKENKG